MSARGSRVVINAEAACRATKFLVAGTILLVASTLQGCVTLEPRRIQSAEAGKHIDCTPDQYGTVPATCADQSFEVAKSYTLHFVEFDDQGRTYAQRPGFGSTHNQIEELFRTIRSHTDNQDTTDRISLVVFVHGWKHSTESNDDNVIRFRQFLSQLAAVEEGALCKRKVIGLYVGWRGESTAIPEPIKSITFYSRKSAAERVATGSILEILGGIRAIQQSAPSSYGLLGASREERRCQSRLKSLYVGHSFGGQILLSAMSQSLLQDIALDRERLRGAGSHWIPIGASLPDQLVVLVNPAIEGARFDALYRVALGTKYPRYVAPRLISITSSDDDATRFWFKLGRSLNTATKRYPANDSAGRDAARMAMGHDAQYLTHKLTNLHLFNGSEKDSVDPHQCDAWTAANSHAKRAALELERAAEVYKWSGRTFNANDRGGLRMFCATRLKNEPLGSEVLVLHKYLRTEIDANGPIWNVTTSAPILMEHNDYSNVRLVEFLRQIYIESMFLW